MSDTELADNRPTFKFELICQHLSPARGSVIRLRALMRDGSWFTIQDLRCPSGRPTAGEATDLVARMSEEIMATIVSTIGVQGVLA